MNTEHHQPASGSSPGCPSTLDLAGYIDGMITSQNQCERIEVHLAHCPACLAAVRAVSQMPDAQQLEMTLVPEHVLQRAMNLVASDVHGQQEGTETGRGGTVTHPIDLATHRQRRLSWVAMTRFVAAAAAAVAVCVLGHAVGMSLVAPTTAPASVAQSSTSSDSVDLALAANITFGLMDDDNSTLTDSSADPLSLALSREVLQ